MKNILALAVICLSATSFADSHIQALKASKVSGTFTAIDGGSRITKIPNVSAQVCRVNLSTNPEGQKIKGSIDVQVLESVTVQGNTTILGPNRLLSTGNMVIDGHQVEVENFHPELPLSAAYYGGILKYSAVNAVMPPHMGGRISEVIVSDLMAEVPSDFSSVGLLHVSWRSFKPASGQQVFATTDINEILKNSAAESEGEVDCSDWTQR